MLNFCTLFDINYLPQGLLMYESLKKNCDDFHLYIFAFCDESLKKLKQLDDKNITIISLKEFEDTELLNVKSSRTKGEYCWTCTSSVILYCLKHFSLESCTYLDADLCFYSNPQILLEEMGNKSVLITEHRYSSQYNQAEKSGKYCVQFVTFKNNEKGLEVLNWWRERCLEWCYNRVEDGKFGDQKYLDDWLSRFDCVYSLKNLGGGLAPWNLQQYKILEKKGKIFVNNDELIFFHFHNLKFLLNNSLDLEALKSYDIKKVFNLLYLPYLKKYKKLNPKFKGYNPLFNIFKNIKRTILWLFKY